MHINRHVHAAFWVKATCAGLNDPFVDSSFIRIPGKELIPYDTFGDPDHITAGSGMSVSQTCLISIDQHEKYNLAEGFTFVNISYSLLGGGAAFCSDPQRATTVERWNASLEAAMEYHKSNMAFDELLQGTLDNVSGGAGTPFLWRSVPRAPFSHEQAGTAHTLRGNKSHARGSVRGTSRSRTPPAQAPAPSLLLLSTFSLDGTRSPHTYRRERSRRSCAHCPTSTRASTTRSTRRPRRIRTLPSSASTLIARWIARWTRRSSRGCVAVDRRTLGASLAYGTRSRPVAPARALTAHPGRDHTSTAALRASVCVR